MWKCKCGHENTAISLTCRACSAPMTEADRSRIYRRMLLGAYRGYLIDFWNSEVMLIIRESLPTKASIANTARGVAKDMEIKSWSGKAAAWIKTHIKGILITVAIILLFSFIKNARYTPAEKKQLQDRHEQSITRREEFLKTAGDKLSGTIEDFELPKREQIDGGFDYGEAEQRVKEFRERAEALKKEAESHFKEGK